MLIGVDIGTTHCKAGLFDTNGALVALAHCPTPSQREAAGSTVYDPEQLWRAVAAIIRQVASKVSSTPIAAVGIASMAETGVLVDRHTGACSTPMIPWFDRGAAPWVARIEDAADRFERFCATGQYPSYKSGLAKLLHLSQKGAVTAGQVWLSAADYIAFRLTDTLTTDYTLASRTYAFRIDRQEWDKDWLDDWNLPTDLFPTAVQSGTSIGHVRADRAIKVGLSADTAVAIAGHDHVCAAFAVGATEPGHVFDSMGTAETLIGAMPERPLSRAEYDAGLTYGAHVVAGRLYWMGGLSASGGSVEWVRSLLGEPPLSYEQIETLAEQAGPDPTGLLYFPYLLGSGTPHPDQDVKAAFIGLGANHTRSHLAKGVLEGAAFELEFVRRAAERGTGLTIDTVVAAGGGTRSNQWMQIKADVGGHNVLVSPLTEATVLGAALLAGIGCGMYRDVAEARSHVCTPKATVFTPNHERHERYHHLYQHVYEPLQQPLRQIAQQLGEKGSRAA